MKKWILLCLLFVTATSLAQSGYNYTYTDPCTLASKSIFVPAGSGVMVNYFDNHSTFTASDFASGVFENWLSQVSQANSSSPCSSVTTALVTSTNATILNNTVGIITNVVSISSLAQSMASISSSVGGSLSSTANGVANTSIGESPSTNQNKSNGSGNNTNGSTPTSQGNQTSNQSQTNNQTPTGTGTSTPVSGGNNTNPNQPTQNGEPTSQSSVEGGGSGSSGNTANSVSNAIDGNNSEGSGSSSSSGSSSKKQTNAKSSSGSLIASGDIVVIASADNTEKNQYKFVSSITHANTRGTRIKGILFNFTTGINSANITLYKSYINKSRSLNTIIANSTMMDFDKNLFNTTTGLESFKFNKSFTGMFGLNFTLGKMGERKFMNLSAVGGGHGSFKVSKNISTSILALAIYSPFTQFYEGKWWDAGLLVVPFNSWDLKITKTFKYNISFTGVYQLNQSFLNYQVLTGGKLTF